MAQLSNVAILAVVIVAAVSLRCSEAEDYTVGGTIGWTSFPPGGASFYSKWAANHTFKVNDTLGECLHTTNNIFPFALCIKHA